MRRRAIGSDGVGEAWSKVGCETVLDLLVDSSRRNPRVPAMIFEDGPSVTCEEMLHAVERCASAARPGTGSRS